MRSTCLCAVCPSCLTLLASPDSTGGGLGRARVVSRRGVLFSFFLRNHRSDLKCLFVRIVLRVWLFRSLCTIHTCMYAECCCCSVCCYCLLLLFVIVHLPTAVFFIHTAVFTVNLFFSTNENTLIHPLAVQSLCAASVYLYYT